MEIVGTYATRSGSLVEVGVRPGPIGLLRRRDGFQVVRARGRARGRWLECEQAGSLERARHLAEARMLTHGGASDSAAGRVCAPLSQEESRELLDGGRERYLHAGAGRLERG